MRTLELIAQFMALSSRDLSTTSQAVALRYARHERRDCREGEDVRTLAKRLIAVVAALIVYKVVWWMNLIAVLALENYFMSGDAPEWTEPDVNWPLVVGYDQVGDWFIAGYPIAVAVAVLAAFWNGRPSQAWRTALYLLVLSVVGPLTCINYVQSDQFINIWLQASLNLFVAFVGYTLVLQLQRITSRAADVQAFQSLAVFGISALLVALPLFYSAIFIAFKLGLLDHRQIGQINEKTPLIFAGGIGAIVALLAGLAKLRSPAVSATALKD